MVLLAARQGGQGGDVDIEDAVARDVRREVRIEGVDAFHEEDVAILQAQRVAGEDAVALLEVELRELHLLAGQQVVELLVQEGDVHRGQRFVVALAVLVDRGVLAVHEIVVHH